MAVDKGNVNSMNNFAIYYTHIEKDLKLANKYAIMSKLKSANKEEECIVCYENKKMYYTHCNTHYICNECSLKLFGKKCPMCRQ